MAFGFCDHKFTSTRSAGAGCRAGDVDRVNIAGELPVWNRGPTCNTIFSNCFTSVISIETVQLLSISPWRGKPGEFGQKQSLSWCGSTRARIGDVRGNVKLADLYLEKRPKRLI